jgi:tripartite-type tricarboxylate transporter receptor subunit TctC
MKRNILSAKAPGSSTIGETIRNRKPVGRALRLSIMAAGVIAGAIFFLGVMVSPLCAQSYPNKPIRLILPFPPGGSTDILGRIIGQKLADRLGQPVVPENRPGAGSNIGIEFAAKARPDGYTVVLASPTLTISPSLYKSLNYDPAKDLAPISLIAEYGYAVVVRPSLQVNSLKAFVDYARANPGKLNHGSSGIGSINQLAAELLKSLAKINVLHIPYKGAVNMMTALMTGEIDMAVSPIASALAQIQAGKVKALAVLGSERYPSLPDVPTAKEAGIDHLVVTGWYGLLVPAGTPREIVNRLNAEWLQVVAMPDTKEKLQNAGVEPLSSTPEHFAEFIKTDIARWAKVVKGANIPRID